MHTYHTENLNDCQKIECLILEDLLKRFESRINYHRFDARLSEKIDSIMWEIEEIELAKNGN